MARPKPSLPLIYATMTLLFISAVAEKISALQTEQFFIMRAKGADFDAFRAILTRPGGELPRSGDENESVFSG